eukprot:gene28362-34241_t
MATALPTLQEIQEWVRHYGFSADLAHLLVDNLGFGDLKRDLELLHDDLSQGKGGDDYLPLLEYLHSIGKFDIFRDALRDYLGIAEEADPASSFVLVNHPESNYGDFGDEGDSISPVIHAQAIMPPGIKANADNDVANLAAGDQSASAVSDLTAEQENSATRRRQNAIVHAIERKVYLDLVFLMDLTSTMGSYILDVKANICKLIDCINAMSVDFRIAIVGYRDHGDKERLVTLEFTQDMEEVIEFLNRQKAEGGGDEAEDVLGGMHVVAFRDNWWREGAQRVVYHIADAPCHGSSFHSRLVEDRHPNGHKDDPDKSLLEILQKLKADRVKYIFMSINNSTDLMINRFNTIVAKGLDDGKVDDTLSSSDKFIETLVYTADMLSVMHLICQSISAHLSSSSSVTSADPDSKEGIDIDELEFIHSSPAGVIGTNVVHYQLLPLPAGLEDFLSEETNRCVAWTEPSIPIRAEINVAIFAEGTQRFARKGQHCSPGSGQESPVVFKTLRLQQGRLSRLTALKCETFLSNHHAATFCAQEFNRHRPTGCPAIVYIDAWVSNFGECKHAPYMICEDMLPQYETYSNNIGYVAPNPTRLGTNHDAVQAFSHWTFCFTRGDLMVVDCQGCFSPERKTFLLTDPALNSIKLQKFGRTNMAVKGYMKFFSSHKCNQYCIQMNIDKERPTDAQLAELKKKERMKTIPDSHAFGYEF